MKMDIYRELGPVLLGGRLKRLGERMQAGAAKVTAAAGLAIQPAHMPLLAALDRQPMTTGDLAEALGISQPGVTRAIGQLVELGMIQSETGRDQRRRTLSLTEAGAAAIARAKLYVWPRIQAAVEQLCSGDADALLARITELEDTLAETPVDVLAARAAPETLILHEYSDALAQHFHDINAGWINEMFYLEETDRLVLENPRQSILDPGGTILFVEARGLGIVGTCALQKTGGRSFELTKMGVLPAARGLKAGEFLLNAMIHRALSLGADPLYLLTSKHCAAAIHLYEKAGFQHDEAIMADYGARYARCDVAMRYAP